MTASTNIAGVDLEIVQRGAGPDLLFLHAGEDLSAQRPWIDRLSERHRVIAPSHPGFGGSRLPDWIGTVDDISYLYLDLADKLKLDGATLVGCSFGGWIAAEMLVRSTARFSRVVLACPLGIKVSQHDVRDIADMHAMTRADFLAQAWADPSRGEIDMAALQDAELRGLVSGREALCLFGWRPYMHNPRLRAWLHRIDRPTLLMWGAADRILSPAYRAGWAEALPQAKSITIADAGHFPHQEQPDRFAAAIREFVAS